LAEDPTSAKHRVKKMLKKRASSQLLMENEIKEVKFGSKFYPSSMLLLGPII